ncbi:MAG: DUF2271 domain-containing protein [Bacteroidales bacterium]|nr:DUF2271 domain-containing protein [Bacteroidales bacterium]
MRKHLLTLSWLTILGLSAIIFLGSSGNPDKTKNAKATVGGEMTFTVRTVTAGGTYSPKHVLAIWVEDADGFVKTRKAMANQRKQYLYTWKAASNYNVVDAITGSTLTSHQTHTVSWDFLDLDGNLVPDGEYTVWVEFTDKHAQGPLYTLTFEKGPDAISLTPADETYFKDLAFDYTPYVAEFAMNETEICEYGTITFTDESVNATSWAWDFGEGAAPATSNTQGPHTVYYTTAGLKTVSLTINGSVTETKTEVILVNPTPEAGFEYAGMGLTVDFTNTSANANTYMWDFGDGNTSSENNPSHTYAEAGSYQVSLVAQFGSCNDEISDEISVPLVSVAESIDQPFEVFPNPSYGIINLNLNQNLIEPGTITIYNPQGQVVYSLPGSDFNAGSTKVDLSNQAKGIYMISFKSETTSYSSKVVLK